MARIGRSALIEFTTEIDDLHAWASLEAGTPGWLSNRLDAGAFPNFLQGSRDAWSATLRDPAARCVRVVQHCSPQKIRGRRECRAHDAPAASCVKKQTHERSHHGHTGTTRHSPRNGFTAYFALSPVTRLV